MKNILYLIIVLTLAYSCKKEVDNDIIATVTVKSDYLSGARSLYTFKLTNVPNHVTAITYSIEGEYEYMTERIEKPIPEEFKMVCGILDNIKCYITIHSTIYQDKKIQLNIQHAN